MPASRRSGTSLHIRLDFGEQGALGPGKIRLLELIAETGSISAAGKAMTMSYRRAWLLVEEINAAFREPLVLTQKGGRGGGGAQVSDFGRDIAARYRRIEATTIAANAADIMALRAALAQGLLGPRRRPPAARGRRAPRSRTSQT